MTVVESGESGASRVLKRLDMSHFERNLIRIIIQNNFRTKFLVEGGTVPRAPDNN
jgi:hypothetical protein